MVLVGGLFALVAGRTGSIWGVSLAHGLTNVVLFLVAPFVLGPAVL
jgi:membrane protease YdiL (CAAX protease family)